MDLLSNYEELGDSDEAEQLQEVPQCSKEMKHQTLELETGQEQIAICAALLSGNYQDSKIGNELKEAPQRKLVYSDIPVTRRKSGRATVGCVGASHGRYMSKQERALHSDASSCSVGAAVVDSDITLGAILSSPPMQFASFMSVKRKTIVNAQPLSQLASWTNHSKAVMRVHWHKPNGQLLMACGMDGKICIWEPFQRSACLRQWQPHGEHAVRCATWFYDNIQILSGGYDNNAHLSNAETGKIVSSFQHTSHVTAVELHPVQRHVFLSGTSQRSITSWDVRCKKAVREYVGSVGQIQDFMFLSSGDRFVTTSDMTRRNAADRAIAVWDFDGGIMLSSQIYQEAYTCTSLCLHPKQSKFVAQSNGGYVAIFSAQPPYKLDRFKRFEKHEVSGFPLRCDISPDGELLYSASADGLVYCYNFHTTQLCSTWPAHNISVDIACHPLLPSVVATTGWDGTVSVWS